MVYWGQQENSTMSLEETEDSLEALTGNLSRIAQKKRQACHLDAPHTASHPNLTSIFEALGVPKSIDGGSYDREFQGRRLLYKQETGEICTRTWDLGLKTKWSVSRVTSASTLSSPSTSFRVVNLFLFAILNRHVLNTCRG